MADNTTEALLKKLKRTAGIPAGQSALDDDELLDILTEELQTSIASFIISFREDFFVDFTDFVISDDNDDGVFMIPSRATSTVLKDVTYRIDDNFSAISVPRVPFGDKDYFSRGFYLEGNKVILVNPKRRNGYTLRLYYFSRPGTLVAKSACAEIASIDTVAGTYTVVGVPSSWGSTETLDITQAQSPLGLISKDDVTTRVANVFTPTTLVDTINVGDFVSLATESCIPQIPLELITLLVQYAGTKVNEILDDVAGMKTAYMKLKELKKSATSILSPRVVEEAKIITAKNSFVSNGTFRSWNNWEF